MSQTTTLSMALYFRLGKASIPRQEKHKASSKLTPLHICRLSMQSDSQLVSAVLDGDQTAFATLVDRYQRAARAAAFHQLGDHHAAEDAAQEAFVTAYQKLSGLRDNACFGPWLLTIVRHKAERIGRADGTTCHWITPPMLQIVRIID